MPGIDPDHQSQHDSASSWSNYISDSPRADVTWFLIRSTPEVGTIESRSRDLQSTLLSLYIHISFCLSVYLPIHLYVYIYIYLTICLSVCLYVCLYVRLSVCLCACLPAVLHPPHPFSNHLMPRVHTVWEDFRVWGHLSDFVISLQSSRHRRHNAAWCFDRRIDRQTDGRTDGESYYNQLNRKVYRKITYTHTHTHRRYLYTLPRTA